MIEYYLCLIVLPFFFIYSDSQSISVFTNSVAVQINSSLLRVVIVRELLFHDCIDIKMFIFKKDDNIVFIINCKFTLFFKMQIKCCVFLLACLFH